MKRRVVLTLGGVLLLCGVLTGPARAQEATAANPEIERLKAQLAVQQEQIDQLRRTLDDQRKMLEDASRPHPPSLGQVASTTPVVPAGEAAPPLHPGLPAALGGQKLAEEPPSPLQIHLGSATITPVGFMDLTAVFRSKDVGSSIGTNFGATPYGNTPLGNLSESRFSAQNSRVGARVDAMVHGAHVIGYWESDFLGLQAANVADTSNSNSFRIRLYWVDLRKDKWEILGGQSWSMLTPNRRGLSPLPADIFNSQDMDTNYQVGLSWTRAPQFRVVYHPNSVVSWGVALEQGEQYGGGSAGGGAITLPGALASVYANQINTGGQTFNVPNVGPDVITKIAFDPIVHRKLMHIELAGFLSSFRTYNPANGGSTFTKQAGGGEVNFNLELVKNFHLIANTFFSDGGGRYLFGQAPDLMVRPDGSVSPIHSYSTVGGFEYQTGNTLLYAYYGGIYIGRNTAIDSANKDAPVGYGYTGAPNSQNRTIQEATFGLVQTFWKNPNYGALQLITQYSYLFRNPWYRALNAPASATNNMVWVDLRYVLPGQAPSVEK